MYQFIRISDHNFPTSRDQHPSARVEMNEF